ncbi:MAG TPA: hypothetical protein PKV84_01535 [Candidatus Omnitrophota bacterium]|nr:hypothetical protein [Candidatus Omnitrophota bacterium]
MRGYVLDVLGKAWAWYKRVVSILAQWIFQMFLRLFIFCVTLYLLGGGCLLKTYRESQKTSEPRVSIPPQYGAGTAYESNPQVTVPLYRERNETLQSQIRTGQSQVRSWDYTVRSIKNDIERWFRR